MTFMSQIFDSARSRVFFYVVILENIFHMFDNTVAYLLEARTVESEKQPLLGNSRRNNIGI
jgi:hypothetical protein